MKNKLLSLLVIGVLLVASGCVYRGAEVTGTDSAVVEYDGYIYYINGMGSTPTEEYQYDVILGALCRMRPDGSDRQIVIPMVVAGYQIAGDEIYFVTVNTDGEFIICVSPINGGSVIKMDKMVAGAFQYIDGYLYYQTETALVRTDSRCKNKIVIANGIPSSIAYDEQNIYCTFADEETGEASLVRVSMDGKQKETLRSDECFIITAAETGIYYLCREDSVLYLYDGSSTEKMIFTSYLEYNIDHASGTAYCAGDEETGGLTVHDMKTGLKRKLTDSYCYNLVRTDKYIYYINGSDGNSLYRADINTGECSLVTSTVPLSSRIFINNGYVYYTSPNERSRIFRINEQTLERECIHYE